MTEGSVLCESEGRGSGATKTPTGVRTFLETGKGSSRGLGACLAASIPETTRAFAFGVMGQAYSKAILAVIAMEQVVGASTMGGDNREGC